MSGAWTARPGAFECIVMKFLADSGHVFIESIHPTCIFSKMLFEDEWFHAIFPDCTMCGSIISTFTLLLCALPELDGHQTVQVILRYARPTPLI